MADPGNDAWNDRDSEGEEQGVIRPSLIRELRNVLSEYPDDGQILQEMIQNAEDAGASTVKILADARHFHQQFDQQTLRQYPHLKYLKGPALCVYNDEVFSDNDWKGIRMLHLSIKEKDPLKVGRFGLGFKSVFHLTDRVVIMSGDYVLYMDPFKNETRYCTRKRIAGRKGKELESILFCMGESLFGVSKDTFRETTGRFPGTLFWFPLRQSPSELSSTLYTEQCCLDLLNAFQTGASPMLLFLNNVESIDLYSKDESLGIKKLFTVGLASSCLQDARAKRQAFRRGIPTDGSVLPTSAIHSETVLTIETKDHVNRSSSKQQENWMVVNYYPGGRELTPDQAALCTDPELSYRPFVGVAIPASGQQDFQSRVFCTLPLPLDTRSITGLPVHVNGFFALSQNRRHLKWPDQLRHRAQLEPSLQWNLFLVTVLLPRAYVQLLECLKAFCPQNPFVVYTAWPNFSTVADRWRPLAKQLYKDMTTRPSFFTPANGGQWIALTQAVLLHFPKEVTKDTAEAVVKVYSLSSENLVQLPEHVQAGLEEQKLLEHASTVNTRRTSELVRGCLGHLTSEDKLQVLEYLCSQGTTSDLVDLHLLPLEGGTFGVFARRGSGADLYWCDEKLMSLFPGLQDMFCSTRLPETLRKHLHRIAEQGSLSLITLKGSDSAIPGLIQKSLRSRFGTQLPTVSLDDVWIQNVWQFLSKTDPWQMDLKGFRNLPLLPFVEEDHLQLLPLTGIYLCSAVQGMRPLPDALVSGLTKLGVTVLSQLPFCVIQHRQVLGELVLYPSMEGVLTALAKVSADRTVGDSAVAEFNSTASQGEREMLLTVLSDPTCQSDKAGKIFQQLKLFTQAGSGHMVSVQEVNLIGPESLPPVAPPMPLLACDARSRTAAVRLGAREITLVEIVSKMLGVFNSGNSRYTANDVTTFMAYFLDNRSLIEDSSLLSAAKQVKFVPTVSGQFKAASELYSPSEILMDLFRTEDKFPCAEISKTDLLDKLKILGLRDESTLKSADLVGAAQRIEELQKSGDTQTAVKKAEGLWKLLVRYGETLLNNDATVLSTIATIHCLPRLQKHEMPVEYPSALPLCSRPVLVPPADMGDYSRLRLLGSVLPVIRSGLPQTVATRLRVGSQESLDHVLGHLNNMIQLSAQRLSAGVQQQDDVLGLILGVCGFIYKYLAEQSGSDAVAKKLSERLSNADVVWTDGGFVPPSRVAFRCNYDCRPYLFQLEAGLQQFRPLFQAIGVQETFNSNRGVWVLQQINTQYCGRPLSTDMIGLVNRAAQMLCEAVKSEGGSLSGNKVFLPDCHAVMRRADQLCFGDSPWLNELENVKFVHDSISVDTARVLGVKTRKRKVYDELVKAIPFGQKEKLTDRIKGLLKGYTIDSSLFKELLQNADDAGATEIRFIKNFRHFGVNRIPEGWEKLQGPALCVYNNRSFTSQDMEGIHNLGRGSKGSDLLKTGQYGVGFNAVYHITDTPSFWTLQDDVDEVICVFDPSCMYLPDLSPYEPGVKFEDVSGLREAYPDLFAAYIRSGVTMNEPGTLFRFPLRTEEMAKTSDIKSDAVTVDDIAQLLENFKEEMGACLLFLNNINSIGIYSATDSGELQLEYAAQKIYDDISSQKMVQYKDSLKVTNALIEGSDINLKDISESETVLHLKLGDTLGRIEDWLIVNKVGFTAKNSLSKTMQTEWKEENFRLMPRGGVAVQLSRYTQDGQQHPFAVNDRRAFCMLPLPVRTNLPMHVNGHFALDHESRRSLWNNKDDARTEWNKAVALQVIVPAYLSAMQHARRLWFPDGGGISSGTSHQLSLYHQLFPDLRGTVSQVWRSVAEEIYRQLAKRELPLFPVVRTDLGVVEWAPAVKRNGQAGLFSNTLPFFQKVAGSTQQTKDMSDKFQLVLKALGMKVLDSTPFQILDNFRESGVENVGEVSPTTVMKFLKSGKSGHGDGCNVGNLPCPVENTPFQMVSSVQSCLLFLSVETDYFQDNLEGLPLCLRQSGNLHYFCQTRGSERPVVSDHVHALPGSAELFVHQQIFTIFQPFQSEKWQGMLQELNIPLLARMLPYSIAPEQYKTGQPCALAPRQKWLRGLWKFLETQLQTLKEEEGIANRQMIEEEIQCLSDWSLIPVKKKVQGVDKLLLYPVKDMHCVVYLPKKRDEFHPQLWEILRQLPCVPLLELSELPTASAATKIVASMSHPVALLHALTSCGEGLTTSPPHARAVLSYFASCLPMLEELYPNQEELRRKLKKLPFFAAVDGNIRSIPPQAHTLCLRHEFPHEGLAEWCSARSEPLVLLPFSGIPDSLSEFLGFQTPSPTEFYCKFLLPGIASLPKHAILPHIVFLNMQLHSLKSQEKGTLCKQLKATAFLPVDGQLYRAQSFFSPQQEVFRCMCPDFFPPPPYCNEEWHSFMKSVGLVCEVTDEMFVKFARKVEREAETEITAAVVAKSQVLAKHLLQKDNLSTGSLLQQVRDIRFLCPSEWMNSPDGQFLTQIAPPYNPGRLVSYAESCSERHVSLVWSSSCVVHQSADPTMLSNQEDGRRLKEILNQLGWQKCAPQDKVIQHVHNVCKALTGTGGQERFAVLGADDSRLNLLLIVMGKLYEYLDKYLEDEVLARLKELPLICDVRRRQMLMSSNVVIDLRPEEAIENFIFKAPQELGRCFSLFLKLGVTQNVTANHYARVLFQLGLAANHQSLHVEEMKIVKTAVEGLFRCLKSKDVEQKSLTANILFLPSETLRLVESSKLVFKDDEKLGDRFRKLETGADFFIGFKKLEIRVSRPQDEVKLLPDQYQMVWLSHIVKEVVPAAVKGKAFEGNISRDLTDTLIRTECTASVVRLAYHQHKHSDKPAASAFTEDTAQQVMRRLTNISVKEILGLLTVLEWNGRQVPGSEMKQPSFMETSEEGGRTCLLYLDPTECRMTGHSVTSSLALAVQYMLKFDSAYAVHLQVIFENPTQATAHLDAHSIERFSLGNFEDDSVFPPPGTFIPVDRHCYLDNNICEFYSGEHVGFEVYDPLVDADGDVAGDPVYIYAKVLREVRNDAQGSSSLLFRRYLVDLGPERGKVEVHATQLYKFIRKSTPSKPYSARRSAGTKASIESVTNKARELNIHSGSSTPGGSGASSGRSSGTGASPGGASPSGAQSGVGSEQTQDGQNATPEEGETEPLDLDTVLKEIRKILTDAWQMDEKDRKRVTKRLFLKWHPDKNPGKEEFCTKVFQALQRYIDILNKGGRLSDDDKKNKSSRPRNDDWSSSRSSSSRGASDRNERRGGTGSSSYGGSSYSRDGSGTKGGGGNASYERSSNRGGSGARPGFDDSFYENMFRRGRSYRESYEQSDRDRPSGTGRDDRWSGSRPGFTSHDEWWSRANPQPGEGRRWFRQAEADLTTAQTISAGGTNGYNWVCYLCCQAVRKALTAVLFHRDANLASGKFISLMQLATKVNDRELIVLVEDLESRIGNNKQMRYPAVFSYPHIPDEVYHENHAKVAFQLAVQIIERVRSFPP